MVIIIIWPSLLLLYIEVEVGAEVGGTELRSDLTWSSFVVSFLLLFSLKFS